MPSDVVWHYTSAEGLMGIVTNHVLRASSCAMMNDSSEFQYGADAIRKVWAEKGDTHAMSEMLGHVMDSNQGLSEDIVEGIIAFLDDTINDLQYENLSAPIFVACASRAENDLSQWRAYANQGGFAIGLDIARGYRIKGSSNSDYFYWQNVHYGVLVDDILETIRKCVRAKLGHYPHKFIDSVVNSTIVRTAAIVKNPGFCSEKEVRIVVSPDHDITDDTKFRAGAYGLTRFVEIESSDAGVSHLLPIREIYVGPSGSTEFAKLELRAFLDRHGYNHAKISASDLPLR